jgi:hypothetical protein
VIDNPFQGMKSCFIIFGLVASAIGANAQNYSIIKFTIAGGGGLNSTGGV